MPETINKTLIKKCSKHGDTSFALNADGRARCRKCSVDAVDKRRRVVKLKSIEYKGGKCQSCGYLKCADALEFHHTTPGEKDFSISGTGVTRSWDKIKTELDKCILLCANCHREAHVNIRSKAEVVLRESDIDLNSDKKFLVHSPVSRRDDVICQACNKKYSVMPSDKDSRRFCSQKCFKSSIRKVQNRPSKEELKTLLWEIPTLQIAKKYGVSDNAVAKWAKAYDLDKPPRGFWAKKSAETP
jgi:5-methylcytosine-specific restriction endonuclease McrA